MSDVKVPSSGSTRDESQSIFLRSQGPGRRFAKSVQIAEARDRRIPDLPEGERPFDALRLRPPYPLPTPAQRVADQLELWELIGTDGQVEQRWVQQGYMRLREAFALHQGVNPDAVFRGDPVMNYLYTLVEAFRHVPGHPMAEFVDQLHKLERRLCRFDFLIPESQVCDRLVSRAEAYLIFSENLYPKIDFHREPEILSDCAHWTVCLTAAMAARELFRTRNEGGTYVPGDRYTLPDVDTFLRKNFKSLDGRGRAAVVLMVWPDGVSRAGRKPKAPLSERKKARGISR